MKKISIALGSMIALAMLSMWAPEAEAYNRYGDGCNNCHGGFRSGSYVSNTAQDGVAWGNNVSLHDGHVTIANGNCQACHVQTGDEPLLGGPSGDSFDSCVGCHG